MNAKRISAIFEHLKEKTVAVVGDFTTSGASAVLDQIIAYGAAGVRPIGPAPERVSTDAEGYAKELREVFASSGAVAVFDSGDGGVVDAAMRESLADLARRNRRIPALARSEQNIDRFRHITLCMTADEAMALNVSRRQRGSGLARLVLFGVRMAERNKRPVFITLSDGILLCASGRAKKVPRAACDVTPDRAASDAAAFATIAAALAGGAKYVEAVVLAAVAAPLAEAPAITREQVAAAFEHYAARFPDALD